MNDIKLIWVYYWIASEVNSAPEKGKDVDDIIGYDGVNKLDIEIHTIEIDGHKVLVVSGEIDVHTSPQFNRAVKNTVNSDVYHLIIDMHNVRYMDSSGLYILFSAAKRLYHKGGTVNIVSCMPYLTHILAITHLNEIINLHRNIDDTIRALSAPVS